MGSRLKRSLCVASALAALACSDPGIDYARPDAGAMRADADDTGRNLRDRDSQAVTPIDPSNDAQDIELTQKIRNGIASNEAMSVQARNVKVIARDGFVTLRGPVESSQEKASIEMLAKNAGAIQIDNQLEIQGADPGQAEE